MREARDAGAAVRGRGVVGVEAQAGGLSPDGDMDMMSPFADLASMSPRNPAEMGRAIRDRRRALGLDQATLATRVGVSRQWIVEMEAGKERAEVGLVLRTLCALGLQLTLAPRPPRQRKDDVFAPGMVDLDAIVERARGRK